MYLSHVRLSAFRNIKNETVSLNPNLNFFVGSNAQGKTNFLEAIYFFSHGKSFRTNETHDLVGWGAEKAELAATLVIEAGTDALTATLSLQEKRLCCNGKKVSGGVGSLLVVLFAPEEILLLKGPPQDRRQYLDQLFGKLSPSYRKTSRDYQRVVRQRNRLLQDEQMRDAEKEKLLVTWDAPLIDLGGRLILERQRWTDRLNQFIEERYENISQAGSRARLEYRPHVVPDAAEFLKRLAERRALEKVLHRTLVGPHRDDFVATLATQPVKSFGSQGEARSFTLALKLAEIDLIEKTEQKKPILLLDDVVSELDALRNQHLFHFLEHFAGQVCVTTTATGLLPPKAAAAPVFRVKNGSLTC